MNKGVKAYIPDKSDDRKYKKLTSYKYHIIWKKRKRKKLFIDEKKKLDKRTFSQQNIFEYFLFLGKTSSF